MKSDELLILYQTTQQRLAIDKDYRERFLLFASGIYKYEFHNAVLAYAQNPDVVMLARYEVWRDHTERGVKKGAKPVYGYQSGNYPFVDGSAIEPLYDVVDTYGYEGSVPKTWHFTEAHKQRLEKESGKSLVDIIRLCQVFCVNSQRNSFPSSIAVF